MMAEKNKKLEFTYSSHKKFHKKIGRYEISLEISAYFKPKNLAARLTNMCKFLVDKEHRRIIKT